MWTLKLYDNVDTKEMKLDQLHLVINNLIEPVSIKTKKLVIEYELLKIIISDCLKNFNAIRNKNLYIGTLALTNINLCVEIIKSIQEVVKKFEFSRLSKPFSIKFADETSIILKNVVDSKLEPLNELLSLIDQLKKNDQVSFQQFQTFCKKHFVDN